VPAGLPAAARQYLREELQRIAMALASVDNLDLIQDNAEPAKYSDGRVVYADGSNWNPGSGEGLYARYNSTWNALGGGGGGGASQLSDLTDVNTSTPTNRNVLVADGVDWESRALVEADISDLGSYTNAAANETITGAWEFENDVLISEAGAGALTIEQTLSGTLRQATFQHTGFNFEIVANNVNDYIFKADRTAGVGNVDFIMTNAAGPTSFYVGPINTSQASTNDGSIAVGSINSGVIYGTALTGAATTLQLAPSSSGYPSVGHTNFAFAYYTAMQFIGITTIDYRDGVSVHIRDSSDADYVDMTHDGIDFNFDFTGTTDCNFDSLSGHIKVDGDTVPVSSGTEGGTGSAGSGNQYVELEIAGTIYKVLHDGTV
jgi:hypothetical protein